MIRLTLLPTFVGILLISSPVLAATYSFSNIIDSSVPAPTGSYFDIGDAAISGNKVAFKAGFNQPFVGIIDGIFTSTGGPRTTVVQELRNSPTGGLFEAIGRPAIEGNSVYFDARVLISFPDGGDGVFYGEGLQRQDLPVVSLAVSPRLVPLNATYKVIADPLISDGYLAFRRSRSGLSVPDAIRIANRERTEFTYVVAVGDLAPSGGTFSSIDANYGLSAGTVAFRGLYGSQEGIFTGAAGAPLTTIAQKGDPTPLGGTFNTVLDPAISGDTVAFLGTYANGNGIFTGNGGPLSTIVTTDDVTPGGNTFTTFSTPAIGRNTVAFRADYSGGGGIYTKTFSSLSKVVEIGDPLFGSTVGSLNFSDLGLDAAGSGNLAFTYGLADGRSGVAMATPGPGLPTIYQDRAGTVPVPDSVGIVWVPVADFAGRNLTGAFLSGADLTSANAHNANLTNAYLKGANLTNANLTGADLAGANLEAVQLAGANFNGATVTGIRFTRLFVTTTPICNSGGCFNFYANGFGGITPAQLYGTTNYQAHDLTGIRLEGNDLTNANLVGQNLTEANFTYATLTGAKLTGTEIRGASFARYWLSTEAQCANFGTCTLTTGIIGSGISLDQLYSTTSYLAHDLSRINFGGNYLAGGNFAEQNLAGANFAGDLLNGSPSANLTNANFRHALVQNVNFRGATLTGANLTGADARRASFADAALTDAVLKNFIQSDGHIGGLDLSAGESLPVRDYDGDPAHGIATLPITVDQNFSMTESGILRMFLETDLWDSTISFAAGIPVALGGTLELAFADGTNLANQVGRTFQLFDWSGVSPTGAFAVSSPYHWDVSRLYSTGEVTLTAVPEPATLALVAFGALGLLSCGRRHLRDIVPRNASSPRQVARRLLLVGGLCLVCSEAAHAAEILVSQNLGTSAYTASHWAEWSPGAEPARAFDGLANFAWNAGSHPMQWLEVDLQHSYNLTSFKLDANQSPAGHTIHEVWLSNSAIRNDLSGASLIHTFSGFTTGAEILTFALPSPVSARFVQIRTTESPSWVSWDEVQVFAAIPEPSILALVSTGLLAISMFRPGRRILADPST